MKLQKTLKVKLGKLSNNKTNVLDRTINKNTKAINFCLKKAKKGDLITHHLVYKDLRKLNLPATIIHGARAKSVEIIKSYKKKKGKKTFPELKNGAIRYDNVNVKLRKTDNKLYKYFISLLYKAGTKGKTNSRIELPLIINSDYQTEIMKEIGNKFKLGSTELLKKNNDFFIHISYSKEIDIPIPDKSFSPVGVDIGINNLAVSVAQSSVKFHNGERTKWKNEFFRRQKAILQSNFAIKEVKRLRGRQTRYNDFEINNIANNIIKQAKQELRPVIVMEDLKDILKTAKVNKKQRTRLHNWVFRRLQTTIEYKANWEGIPVEYIDPKYTSQTCSKCGELNKRTRHTYKCKSCGYEANADYNAGRNIQQVFLAKCQEEQATINIASNDTIPEPQAKKDGSLLCTPLKEDNKPSVRNFKRKEVSIPHTESVCILEKVLWELNSS